MTWPTNTPEQVAEAPDHHACEGCTAKTLTPSLVTDIQLEWECPGLFQFKVAKILFSIATGLPLLQLLQELQGGGWQETKMQAHFTFIILGLRNDFVKAFFKEAKSMKKAH